MIGDAKATCRAWQDVESSLVRGQEIGGLDGLHFIYPASCSRLVDSGLVVVHRSKEASASGAELVVFSHCVIG